MNRNQLMNFWALVVISVAAGSCGKTDAPVESVTPPAASAPAVRNAPLPSANVPVTGHTVKVAAGVDLSQVRNQQMIQPQFALTPPDVESAVLFAVVQNDKDDTGAPVVLKKIDDQWKIVEIAEAGDQEWVYAAACAPRHELWAILDSAAETRAAQLTLMHSTDDGLTWQFFAAVKKPVVEAEFAGFSLAANGEGKLSMHLDDDAEKVLHGYYHYKTSDGGKTWAGPTFEGDDITEADSQRDLDTIQEAIKNAETVPAQ